MKTALKTLALAAALLAPAPVLAQAAAGSVPNSFDAPAAQATPAPQRPGQAPVQTPAAAASTYVGREVTWWRALLAGNGDAISTTALLAELGTGRYRAEPPEGMYL